MYPGLGYLREENTEEEEDKKQQKQVGPRGEKASAQMRGIGVDPQGSPDMDLSAD